MDGRERGGRCGDSREQARVAIPDVAAFLAEKIEGATSNIV